MNVQCLIQYQDVQQWMAACRTVFVILERDAAFNQTAPRNVSRLLFLEPDPCVHMVSTWKKKTYDGTLNSSFFCLPKRKSKWKLWGTRVYIVCKVKKSWDNISKIVSRFLYMYLSKHTPSNSDFIFYQDKILRKSLFSKCSANRNVRKYLFWLVTYLLTVFLFILKFF